MIRKILCSIKIHKYEDHIKLKAITDKGMPFSAKEVCKGCGKIRNEVSGFIEDSAAAWDSFAEGRKGEKKWKKPKRI